MSQSDIVRMMALRYIQSHPEILQTNPKAQELYTLIQSGDATRGVEVANNLCRSYETTPEQAIELAKQRYGSMQQRTN